MNPLFMKILRFLLGASSSIFLLMYLVVAVTRMNYPFELEWTEGGQVDHVLRILRGQQMYVEPSLEFAPYVYNPLYFYAAAAMSWIVGSGFFPLRLLSFLASLGLFLVLFRFVQRETTSPFAALLSTGLFAATYPLSGGWFDTGRIDSLFLLPLLAGFHILRFDETRRGAILAGVMFFLSIQVKQSAVIPAVAMTVFLLIENRQRGIFFAGISIGLNGVAALVLDALHNGWYFYIVSSAGNIPIQPFRILGFWTHDLAPRLMITLVLSAFAFALMRRWESRHFRFHLFMAGSMLAMAWTARIHNGGYINVLIPFHLQIAILAGICYSAVNKMDRPLYRWSVHAVLAAQFAILIYNPVRLIPTKQDRLAGEQMIQRLRDLPGEVLIPYHGYYSTMAGKSMHAHIMTMIEVVISGDSDLSRKLVELYREAIREQRYAAIVLDREWFREDLEKYYVKAGKVFESDDVFWPVTGARNRPEWIYVPKNRK